MEDRVAALEKEIEWHLTLSEKTGTLVVKVDKTLTDEVA